jgi:hypothetical protein
MRTVVLKLDAPDLAHKTEASGVVLGLADEASIRDAVAALRDAAMRGDIVIRGLLVEPMAPAGVEMIVGGRRDAVFGPAVLVGVGGVLAEVLDDVAVMLAPVTQEEVEAAIGRLRGAALLRGARGTPAANTPALARVVVAIADVLLSDPSIVEVDCNPVIVGPDGALAVDALVVLEDAAG